MNSLAKFLRRFGRKEILGWPFFWFALPFYFALSFFFDVVLASDYHLEWALIGAITFFAAALVVFLLKLLLMRNATKRGYTGLVTVIILMIAGAVKNTLVGYLSLQFGLVNQVDWFFRVYGGAGLAISVALIYAFILGARFDHDLVMDELDRARNKLNSHRQQAEKLFELEHESLLALTQKTLLPKLDKIQASLTDNSQRLAVVEELRLVVNEQVRPLSANLSQSAKVLTAMPDLASKRPKRNNFFSKSVSLRQLIRPGQIFILLLISQWFLITIILGQTAAVWSLLCSVGSWLVIVLIKLLIPVGYKATVAKNSWLMALIGFAAVQVSYWPLKEFSHNLPQDLVLLILVPNAIACLVGFAYSKVLDVDRFEAEQQMSRENGALAREIAIFDQQVWVARRNWSFVIHGTVQSALTAALTRLAAPVELEQYQIDMIKQDLTRAINSLRETPTTDVDLAAALQNLASTWQGICKVSWEFTDRAGRALMKDQNLRLCVNEIAKEAVSNAVRHGEAEFVDIKVDRTSDELLHLLISNNGRSPASHVVPGVGSAMFDDLTLDWSLTQNRTLGLTVLEANLPSQIISSRTESKL